MITNGTGQAREAQVVHGVPHKVVREGEGGLATDAMAGLSGDRARQPPLRLAAGQELAQLR